MHGFHRQLAAGMRAAAGSNGLLTNLVAYWPLDGSSPTADVHGAFTLTSEGTVTSDNTSPLGNGADFNIARLVRSDTGLSTIGASFTVSVWARLDAYNVGNFGSWLVNRRDTSPAAGYWQFGYRSDTPSIRLHYFSDGGVSNILDITPRLPVGNWHHYVIGVNSVTLEMSVYIDGVFQDSAAIPDVTGTVDNRPFGIGANAWGASATDQLDWNGAIADCGYWVGRAPDQAMVDALYNSGNGLAYGSFQ
jgi:hypothetical protein